MDLQTFLSRLEKKLRELGADEFEVKKHIVMFERYLKSLGEDKLQNTLDEIDEVDTVAINIYNLIEEKALKQKNVDADEITSADNSDSQDILENSAEPDTADTTDNADMGVTRIMDAHIVELRPEDIRAHDEPDGTGDNNDDDDDLKDPLIDYIEGIGRDNGNNSNDNNDDGDDEATKTIDTVQNTSVQNHAQRQEYNVRNNKKIIYQDKRRHYIEKKDQTPDIEPEEDEERSEKYPGSPVFWVSFILTLPITLPIVFAVILLFVAVFAAASVLIAALMVGLVALVAAGTAISLTGLIYGITQTITSLPIGLFEIGLGVVICGSVMFSGILIYNTAIRLLPFAIKNLVILFIYTLGRLRALFNYLKKESSGR